MNAQIQRELQGRIEAFASDITTMLQRAVAESVAEALGGLRGARGGLTSTGKRRGRPPGPRAVAADTLLREVAREDGRRMEQIAKSLGTSTKALSASMKQLVAEKKVKTTGQARGTKYFAK